MPSNDVISPWDGKFDPSKVPAAQITPDKLSGIKDGSTSSPDAASVAPNKVPDAGSDAASSFAATQPTDQTTSTPTKPDETKSASPADTTVRVINVVRDYDWTLSMNRYALADTIPYIKMREFDIVSSNIATSMYATLGTLSVALNANKEILSKGLNASGLSEQAKQTLSSGGKKITETVSSLLPAQLKKEDYGVEWGNGDLAATYGGLYLRQPTNMQYVLPYFTKTMTNLQNSFNDSADAGATTITSKLFGKAAEDVSRAVNEAATLPSLVEPGVYIERPKFFQFGGSVVLIEFSFTLFNTVTNESYLRNSDLIKKLLLKNLPQRVDKIVIYPPAIYEVTIPGRAFYPYCYIDHLSVSHEGTKRIIQVQGRDEIVPDAYVVTITIKSLTSDSSNFYVPQTGNAGIDFNQRRVSTDFIQKRPDTSALNSVTQKDSRS